MFQDFPGEHALDPLQALKKFFSPLRGSKHFLGIDSPQPPKQKNTRHSPGWVTHTALFLHQYAGFSPEKDKSKTYDTALPNRAYIWFLQLISTNTPPPRTHTPLFS